MVQCSCVRSCVCLLLSLHSVSFGQLLRCARKRIVNNFIMKVYIERNNIQVELIRFRKKIATLLKLESLKWENFRDRRVYEVGLIATHEVSPLFDAESRGPALEMCGVVVQGLSFIFFPGNKERRHLWNSTVNHYRQIPRAGSLKLCLVWSFLTMTDERAIIELGLRTGPGSSHGKSPFMTI